MIGVEELKTLKTILINRVTEQLGDPNLNASRLINALADLTVHDASEPDIGWDKAKYHSTRLAVELGNAKNDADKDRRYINRIWKDMIEAFEVIEPSIENDARKEGFRKILKPKKTDPKTGRVEFYLGIEELGEEEFPVDMEDAKKHGNHIIHYERIKNPKPSILGRFFSSIVLDKPRAYIHSFLPLVIFLILSGWFLWIVNDDSVTVTTAFLLCIFYAIWSAYIFRAFYQVRDKFIIKAPVWMPKFFEGGNAQLEMLLTDKVDSDGDPIVAITLVVYASTCSICGRPVYVDKGAGMYRGRLIGKCAYNPVEHIFSFDHVTRKGIPLRKDIYLGQVD